MRPAMRILMLAGNLSESAEIVPTTISASMPVLRHLTSTHEVSLVLAAGRSAMTSPGPSGNLRAAVDRRLREDHIDAIHLDHLSMAQFVPASWRRPIVLHERRSLWRAFAGRVNETGDPLRRWLLKRQREHLRTLEAAVCRRASVTIAESEMERAALEQIVGAP